MFFRLVQIQNTFWTLIHRMSPSWQTVHCTFVSYSDVNFYPLFIFSGDHKGSVWRGPQSPVWRRLLDHLWQDHPPGRLTLLLWRDEWNTSVLCLRRCLCKKMYYSSKKMCNKLYTSHFSCLLWIWWCWFKGVILLWV